MIIEFRASDRALGAKALGIYEKLIDTAIAACGKVYAPTLWLDAEKGRAEQAASWLGEALDDFGVGESRDVEIPSPLAVCLANAASAYLASLTKLAEKQTDLLVPLEETNEITSQVASLADRLRGQTELVGTVSVDGGEPVPFVAERAD